LTCRLADDAVATPANRVGDEAAVIGRIFERISDATHRHAVARKLTLQFDPVTLAADLSAVPPGAWQQYRGKYHDDGRYLSAAADKLFQPVLQALPAPVWMSRLTRLLPGGTIARHRDNNVARNIVRIHVPIVTAGSVEFRIGGVALPMRPGEAWHIDPRFPHEVHNRGDSDRVHLIVDLFTTPALQAMLAAQPPVRDGFLTSYLLRETILWAPRRVRAAVSGS
jgi:quercetin dioxygenase-like cupin family protein